MFAIENFVNSASGKTMRMDLIRMVFAHFVKEYAFVQDAVEMI